MNTFGRILRISIFGESHGNGAGVTIDGAPPGVPFDEEAMTADLARRRSGRAGTTPRREPDKPRILTGTFEGHTTGAPITVWFDNTNTRSRDYSQLVETPRPGHADLTAARKYGGFQDYRGGGHFSGRITLGLVAAGALAKRIIAPTTVVATLLKAGGREDIEAAVLAALANEDSLGGLIECVVTHMPIGIGEPFFDSVEARLSHIVFSIPATRGIEFGTGFAAADMRGSEHNDCIVDADGTTETNHAAGVNGGISNGNDLVFRVAIKPTSSVGCPQETYDFSLGHTRKLVVEGRHDACVALRVPPVLEAATALVLADLMLTAKATAPLSQPAT
ncbi:MAG: chorismate synthase [Lentisphaeria bacterium]|nr:chorismate synthase [Lentisphaeria bacterium]